MGENTGERQLAYSKYLTATVPDYELKLIREALQRGQVTGGADSGKKYQRGQVFACLIKGRGAPEKLKLNLKNKSVPFCLTYIHVGDT